MCEGKIFRTKQVSEVLCASDISLVPHLYQTRSCQILVSHVFEYCWVLIKFAQCMQLHTSNCARTQVKRAILPTFFDTLCQGSAALASSCEMSAAFGTAAVFSNFMRGVRRSSHTVRVHLLPPAALVEQLHNVLTRKRKLYLSSKQQAERTI